MEKFQYPLAALLSHPLADLGVFQQVVQLFGQPVGIVGPDHEAGDAVLDAGEVGLDLR